MEAMIHAGRQAQRDVTTVPVEVCEVRIPRQLWQGVGRSLDLQQRGVADWARRTDNTVAGAHQDIGAAIDAARPHFELPDEAFVQALEGTLFRFGEVGSTKQSEDRNRA